MVLAAGSILSTKAPVHPLEICPARLFDLSAQGQLDSRWSPHFAVETSHELYINLGGTTSHHRQVQVRLCINCTGAAGEKNLTHLAVRMGRDVFEDQKNHKTNNVIAVKIIHFACVSYLVKHGETVVYSCIHIHMANVYLLIISYHIHAQKTKKRPCLSLFLGTPFSFGLCRSPSPRFLGRPFRRPWGKSKRPRDFTGWSYRSVGRAWAKTTWTPCDPHIRGLNALKGRSGRSKRRVGAGEGFRFPASFCWNKKRQWRDEKKVGGGKRWFVVDLLFFQKIMGCLCWRWWFLWWCDDACERWWSYRTYLLTVAGLRKDGKYILAHASLYPKKKVPAIFRISGQTCHSTDRTGLLYGRSFQCGKTCRSLAFPGWPVH